LASGDLVLPFFLTGEAALTKKEARARKKELQRLQDAEFMGTFEWVLDRVSVGDTLMAALADDVRDILPEGLLRWIKKDEGRLARYEEAQELGCEVLASQCIEIADGVDSIEDVNRSRLRIETRQKLMKAWNKERYGDIKQVETTVNINLGEAMQRANARVGRVIEGELGDDDEAE